MFKVKKTLIFGALTSLLLIYYSPKVQSSILIEPAVGYKQETLKLTHYSQNTDTYKMNGAVLGLKLGVESATGVGISLVGEYSSGKASVNDASTLEKPKFTHTLAGAQLSVSAMNTLKIYLGYAPLNELDIKANTSVNGMKLKGHAYQAGIMIFPTRSLGLGVQYNIHQFKEISGTTFTNGSDIKTYYDKIDAQDISLNLSIAL